MNWRLALLVALMAAPGPVAIAWLALPLLVTPNSLPVPVETLQLATATQGIVLAALASAVGALLGAKVGLRAPAMFAIATRGDVYSALRPQLLPGVVGGVLGATPLALFAHVPADVSDTRMWAT